MSEESCAKTCFQGAVAREKFLERSMFCESQQSCDDIEIAGEVRILDHPPLFDACLGRVGLFADGSGVRLEVHLW